MNYEFKRWQLIPVLFLVSSFFSVGISVLVSFRTILGELLIGFAMVSFIHSVYCFLMPFIKIKNGIIYHRKRLFASEDFEIAHLDKIELVNKYRLDVIFVNGHTEKIDLFNMLPTQREEFVKLMENLIMNNKKI